MHNGDPCLRVLIIQILQVRREMDPPYLEIHFKFDTVGDSAYQSLDRINHCRSIASVEVSHMYR